MSVVIDVYHDTSPEDELCDIRPNSKDSTNQVPCKEADFCQIKTCVESTQQLQAEVRGPVHPADVKIILYNIPASFVSRSFLQSCTSVGIEVEAHQNTDYLFRGIDSNPLTTHYFIIHASRDVQQLIDQAHLYQNIRAIYIECESTQLIQQRRLARNYPKLNAVFDESLRLLIKITMDIALFFEETADRQKDDASLIEAARRNYQRSIDLYTFAETLI